MNLLKLNVFDVSGRRSCQVEAPDDIPIDRIILLLVEKMDLPINSPDGQIMSYKMHHRKTAAQLIDRLPVQLGMIGRGNIEADRVNTSV